MLRFGELPAEVAEHLQRASAAELERWSERVLTPGASPTYWTTEPPTSRGAIHFGRGNPGGSRRPE